MDNKEQKLEKITEMLWKEYKGYMSEQTLDELADELYHTFFASQNELSDIMAVLTEAEEEARIHPYLSAALCIFCWMLELLENNEVTAQRLYYSFMNEFDCLETFVKLYKENAEYISVEKLAKAKEKAFNTFDRVIL
ncbi:MAG: hypothetical protein K2K04_00290, partial [Clostridia bacterium]|nr:hypothetical protein [Clostridia bacterium]